ncbi:MAG: hypothetical protein FRX49_08724 [Trebouxia sp. A1-2]|nr:MAG: hypothetical protein FRX49_08724 [Trebouxia sp. A1-2]
MAACVASSTRATLNRKLLIRVAPTFMGGLTNEVEAEDTKSHCTKEGKGIVQVSEQGIQEGCHGWVHKDVEQDLQQPADAETHPHHTKEKLEVLGRPRNSRIMSRGRATRPAPQNTINSSHPAVTLTRLCRDILSNQCWEQQPDPEIKHT